ncbi:septum formation protein Maf [bacterium]|nr:MAG: septum formation protein Maf [bacterium]
MNIQKTKYILASQSPRRSKLLAQIGINFETLPSNFIEDLSINLPPSNLSMNFAKNKAKAVAKKYKSRWVIGADTIVTLKGRIFGKPNSFDEGNEMLRALSGKTHDVFTGVSIQNIEKKINLTFNERTKVTLKKLTDEDIFFYLKNYKPYDKSGSYGIQGYFSVYVKKIDGCYFNIVGLPLHKLYLKLKSIDEEL